MKVTPLKHYHQPAFPTRQALDEHPELLRLVPRRWRNSPIVLAALATTCALAVGHHATAQSQPDASRIAPIFQHGEGRGAFGGKTMGMTGLLTEAEARQVIIEEAKRAGISFTIDSKTLAPFALPEIDPWAEFRSQANTSPAEQSTGRQTAPRTSLTLDGTDPKRNISFEYVSTADLDEWSKNATRIATIENLDAKGAATLLRQSLRQAAPDGTYAVFYDPMAYLDQSVIEAYSAKVDKIRNDAERQSAWQSAHQQMQLAANQQSKEQLRAQVRDFIKWLKSQGVI